MVRSFLEVGKEYNSSLEKRQILAEAIKSLRWYKYPAKGLPAQPSFALLELVARVGFRPDKVGFAEFDSNLILAIRNNYRSGTVRRAIVYGIDTGRKLTLVAVDEERH